MAKQKLNKELLDKLLWYNEDTGEVYWKYRDRAFFNRDQDHSRWNNRFANKPAGNILEKPCGYRSKYVKIFGNSYQLHRIVWLLYYGIEPDGDLDHKDKDGTNNRINNLRIVTKTGNMRNTKLYKSNTSGIKGVSKYKGLWRARININGVDKHLGLFQDRFEAICARKSQEVKYNFT